MNKRWLVNVWFTSPDHPDPVLVEGKLFRFWLCARLFAHSRNVWDNWRQTKSEIVRLPAREKVKA